MMSGMSPEQPRVLCAAAFNSRHLRSRTSVRFLPASTIATRNIDLALKGFSPERLARSVFQLMQQFQIPSLL
jgi:hypothetical protein